jgi:hypothetical protein
MVWWIADTDEEIVVEIHNLERIVAADLVHFLDDVCHAPHAAVVAVAGFLLVDLLQHVVEAVGAVIGTSAAREEVFHAAVRIGVVLQE